MASQSGASTGGVDMKTAHPKTKKLTRRKHLAAARPHSSSALNKKQSDKQTRKPSDTQKQLAEAAGASGGDYRDPRHHRALRVRRLTSVFA